MQDESALQSKFADLEFNKAISDFQTNFRIKFAELDLRNWICGIGFADLDLRNIFSDLGSKTLVFDKF